MANTFVNKYLFKLVPKVPNFCHVKQHTLANHLYECSIQGNTITMTVGASW